MIERIAALPDGVKGFRAHGTVTPSHYRETVLPELGAGGAEGGLRVLYVAGRDFERYSGFDRPSPESADLAFDKLAFVTDREHYGDAVHAFGWPLPRDARVYPERALDRAVAWLAE